MTADLAAAPWQREPKLNGPIGIFDSGVGGLHVLAALRRRLPGHDFIYLGDTARLPYGNKSAASLRAYASACVARLVAEGAQLVVVACNTAAAAAGGLMVDGGPVPVLGVVEAGAQAAVAVSAAGRIGVVGTHSTIDSGCFPAAIASLAPAAGVWARACPVWVALAEAQMAAHPATALICADDLRPLLANRIDTLLLACTHFPLLQPTLSRLCGPQVQVVDGAAALAEQVGRLVGTTISARQGRCRLLATDDSPRLWQVAEQLVGRGLGPPQAVELGVGL